MKLFESISCSKGITLNSQIVDLLAIIDNEELSIEEQDNKIIEYVTNLQNRINNLESYIEEYGESGKSRFILDDIFSTLPLELTDKPREDICQIYLDAFSNSIMVDTKAIKGELRKKEIPEEIAEYILVNIKDRDYRAKIGILEMTPEKVRALYDFMFKSGNRFDILNIDDAGKYSNCVSFDGKTFTPNRLDKMFDFAQKHRMQPKINAFVFYGDFPVDYENYCIKKYTNPEMSEEEKIRAVKPYIKQTLMSYTENVCKRYGNQISAVDVLNEIIYDPDMIEENFRGSEENSYHQRTGQWMKYLDLEDLAELSLEVRNMLPNARLLYNDMNLVNPEKRSEIIEFIKKMQEKEREFRRTGRLGAEQRGIIDTIGLEAHLDTSIDILELDKTLDDIERQVELPVEITELDISRTGKNPLSKIEISRQQKILARIHKLANQTVNRKPRITAITMWSPSDDMCFVDEKCKRKVYGSVIDSNFQEKEFEPEKQSEYQQFNYHTHTKLCGHAYGEIREYIENAIEAGFTQLGFSDHNPPAFGTRDPKVYMSKEQFFEEYLPILKELRKEYSDKIDISIGLEVEYYGDEGEKNEIISASRKEIEGELDYMILGQHFVIARDNNGKMMNPPKKSDPLSAKYPLDYAYTVVEAMKTGKFAYVAHPDIFMRYRDSITEDKKQEYDKNVSMAIEMICEVASKYRIPLEINLGAISAHNNQVPGSWIMKDNQYAYPVTDFWKVVAEKGCDVLVGVDAHTPDAFLSRDSENIAKKMMKDAGINLHYLENFEPLGIGRETERASTGKKILDQVLELSEKLRNGEINEEIGKIRRTVKDLEENRNVEEEQI